MGRTEHHHSADVGRAIAEQLTEEGKIPPNATVLVEHVTIARIRVLRSNGTEETEFEQLWSRGVEPDSHFAWGHRMIAEGRRRMGI